MILDDASVWIEILREKTGNIVKAFQKAIGAENYAISRFQQLELLQGASDQKERMGIARKLPLDPIIHTNPQGQPSKYSLKIRLFFVIHKRPNLDKIVEFPRRQVKLGHRFSQISTDIWYFVAFNILVIRVHPCPQKRKFRDV